MSNRGRGQYWHSVYSSAYSSGPPQMRPTQHVYDHRVQQNPWNSAPPRQQCPSGPYVTEERYNYPSNMSQQQYNIPVTNYQPYEHYDPVSAMGSDANRQIELPYMDEVTTSWLNKLRHLWTLYKRSPAVTQTLHGYFDTSPNPYKSALMVMTNCGDFHQAKANSLAFTVIEEFSRWLTPNRDSLRDCLTKEIKLEAFKTVTNQRQPQLVKMVIDAYEMGTHKDIFLEAIAELIKDKQYKEACQSVTHLGLHQYFAVEDILVPLVFQDKLNVAFDFLAKSPKHQKDLVMYLDKLLGMRSINNEVQNIIGRLEIPDVKRDKLYGKPLSKLVGRLVKTYHLSEDVCPNLNKKRRDGALQFIIGKRYNEGNLSLESWREMALEAVRDDEEMHAELVASVSQVGDPGEALYWAKRLGVPQHRWPVLVQEEALKVDESPSHYQAAEESENWDDGSGPTEFHPFGLETSDIIIVDSKDTFDYLHESIRGEKLVGIDSEWKAHFGTGGARLALIQVATSNQVFILDVVSLSQRPDLFERHWMHLSSQLFNNKEIRKLGFGLSTDLQMIRSAVKGLTNITQQGTNFLEFIHLWKYLVSEGLQFPQEGCDNGGEGLSRLVECTLGKPLNKAEQFSNWENRPLRECQKIYAATDAHCLLQVYEALENLCQESARYIPFDQICDNVVSSIKMKKVKKIKPVVTETHHSTWGTARRPRDVKAVADNMIHGLGLHLRKCGVDVVNIRGDQSLESIQDLVDRDKRIIITRGKRYNELAHYVPLGCCYAVKSNTIEEQVAEVLQHFNIVLNRDDVFTRCFKCNCSTLLTVSNKTMAQLAENRSRPKPRPVSLSHYRNWVERSDSEDESPGAPCRAPSTSTSSSYRPPEPGINVESCTTSVGVDIGVAAIPEEILSKKELFYVCQECGKCYWDGSHIDRFLDSIKENLPSN